MVKVLMAALGGKQLCTQGHIGPRPLSSRTVFPSRGRVEHTYELEADYVDQRTIQSCSDLGALLRSLSKLSR